ncbi:hypothetical protein [Desulfobacter sp.]|uniref:hypothetical protein n=1 Tax=Desulfobacter sp. TaxID=2294 RepID=UPI000E8113D7|nr:hypothetical protein [Desulfobacter sp.]HBT87683.1 hypothetical protein [Desulfobacter sp.]
MNEKRLGDYLNPEDDESFEDDRPGIGGATFQEEANTLQIEKLSQRVTIISVIVPCIIIAILVFVYMDITEKVVDVDQTQANQMARVSQDLDIKLNALDVRIAKATHELDEKLTALESKRKALENQTAKMSAAKVDRKAMEAALAKLDKRIHSNADQDKSTLAAMERINRELISAIDKNSSDTKALSGQIQKEFHLFKEEFGTKLLELSAYEQKISQLLKETGLLGKKLDALQNETAASIDKRLDKNLNLLRQDFEKNLSLLRQDLEKQIADVKRRADAAEKAAATAAAAAAAAKSTPKQLPPKSTNQVQSTVKPQASSPNALPTPTRKTQTPDLPRQTIPGTGNISEQDISQ